MSYNNTIHPGAILIASPLLTDQNFNRTVVLILDKDKDRGFLGLVLNRQMTISIEEVLDIKESGREIPLFNGGPVDLQRLFWLHTLGPEFIRDSVEILPGLYVGGSFDDIQLYALAHPKDNGKYRFYLGYCGWTKGQLEQEVTAGAWAINNLADPNALLHGQGEEFWYENVKAVGDNYRHWLMLPSDPSLN